VNRHAKAPSAGLVPSQVVAVIPVLVALLALVFVPNAGALTQRPFKEPFGSAAQPTIGSETVTVELRSGDVLVGTRSLSNDFGGTISRFHADGTPAPFPGLGTNVIDGKEANGKPCPEEPASCDKTPHDGLEIGGVSGMSQIAVDESGGITDGDIYVTENDFSSNSWVDIFAPDGTYLGELSGPQVGEVFDEVDGVAVDKSGAVFLSAKDNSNEHIAFSGIEKFVPTANPVVNSDRVFGYQRPDSFDRLGNIALGTGPTTGSLFVAGLREDRDGAREGAVFQFDSADGNFERTFASNQADQFGAIAVDPNTGTVLFQSTNLSLLEYEAVATSEPKKLGRLLAGGFVGGFGLNEEGEAIVGESEHFGIYGTPAPVPSVTVEPASGVSGTKAVLSGTVNPNNLPLTGCFFEYGESEETFSNTAPCEGPFPPTDSSPHRVQAEISGLKSNGHTYKFRLVATAAGVREESPVESLTTLNTVVTQPAGPISTTGATLNGIVRPEGEKTSACFFEFGLNTNPGFERRIPCIPGATELPQGFSPQSVSAPIAGLEAATTYRYRLVATTPALGTLEGEELTFTTQGAPRITDVRARDADQSSAALEAKINPSGFGTSYRFEWGPTASYGHRVPAEFEPFIGTGETPVRVTTQVLGLAAASTYHYRIVASSSAGIVASSDHTFETLNSCGLPQGRCFELVSRAEAGPVALPGQPYVASELWYQADPAGGNVAYPVESGYPEARKGNEVLYRADRGSSGWQSTELSPPIVAPNEINAVESNAGVIRWLSNDLSCGFVESTQPLTEDAAARQVIEAGGANFYRMNPDHSYTVVTGLAPENLGPGGEQFDGASQDCKKVIFETGYRYPGVTGAALGENGYIYEWDEGTLRGVEGKFGDDKVNVVSEDGSRVFFANGRLLENGSITREYAASQTANPAVGVQYQWATDDGSRVFFTANAGLSAEASGEGTPEGTDLYEYDLDSEELTDRTVVQAKGGARVAGFIGASEDGSVVYFGSPAQLLPGRGPTLAQNQKANTNSIYRESGGRLTYVGGASPTQGTGLYIKESSEWASRVSADGRYLLFQSAANLTGYDSGGSAEAYLFDGDGGPEGTTTCTSCRQDGLPSLVPAGSNYQVLPSGKVANNLFYQPHSLVVRDGRPEVFFSSMDALAPGAVAGQNNIYQWAHDQVFRLISAPEGTQDFALAGINAVFAGASADGTDVYLASPENLSWEDQDRRSSIFDARIGGGYPEPPPPPAPCAASAEGSCQGPAQATPATPGAASASFNGPGNPPEQKKSKKKTHKKKQQHAKKKGKGKKARHANGNRRAGK
jgi:hypothetical protein